MPSQEVLAQYQVIQDTATQLNSDADTFDALVPPLNSAAEELRVQAFVGLTGDKAAQALVELQSQFNKLAERCRKMSGDVLTILAEFQAVDEIASNRFDNAAG